MSHRLSSDHRPISLSMPSLNVNSCVKFVSQPKLSGFFAFQIATRSAFLFAAADERGVDAPLRATSILSEDGSPAFNTSREDDPREPGSPTIG